jgi:hypothetical protein
MKIHVMVTVNDSGVNCSGLGNIAHICLFPQ